MKRLALLCALWAGCAFAQPPGTHPSYVAIEIRSDSIDTPPAAFIACGGVVVDEKKKLIATAWHCVPNSSRLLNDPGAFQANGSPATLLVFSPEADLAILKADDIKGVRVPKFATPKKGEEVTASAYYDSFVVGPQGTTDRYFPPTSISLTLDWKTEVAGIGEAKKREAPLYDQLVPTGMKWIVMTGNPAQGFSGAPVFDKSGGFVGIISNGNGGFTNVSSSENVKKLLEKLP